MDWQGSWLQIKTAFYLTAHTRESQIWNHKASPTRRTWVPKYSSQALPSVVTSNIDMATTKQWSKMQQSLPELNQWQVCGLESGSGNRTKACATWQPKGCDSEERLKAQDIRTRISPYVRQHCTTCLSLY